jgi:hypothetical protein
MIHRSEDISEDYIAVLERSTAAVCRKQSKTWEYLDVPPYMYVTVGLAGHYVFLGYANLHASGGAGIIQVDLDTRAVTTLASCQRRPPQSPLDDVDPYEVRRIYALGNDAIMIRLQDTSETYSLYKYYMKENRWEKSYSTRQEVQTTFTDGILINLMDDGRNHFTVFNPLTNETTRVLRRTQKGADTAEKWKWEYDKPFYPKGFLYDGGTAFLFCRDASTHWINSIIYLDESKAPRGVLIPLKLRYDDHSECTDDIWRGVLVPKTGLIVWEVSGPGFWFIPMKDIEDYVASHKTQHWDRLAK